MTWELAANVVVGGFLIGLVYALMALGLSVIFGVTHIVNFAHGEMTVLAMFAAVVLFNEFAFDPLLATPVVAATLFFIGYQLQRRLVEPFVTRPDYEQFLLLLAVAIALTNGLLIMFGPEAHGIITDYSFDSYEVGPLIIDKTKAIGGMVAVLAAAILLSFFRYSMTGRAIRACADNLTGAGVVGLNVPHLYAMTFAIGAAAVGVAGCLLAIIIDATPILGPELTLLAFIIVIVGGLGSMAGALLGGILIGVSEAVAGLLLAPSLKSMFSFGLLILVLLLRPQGLFGRAGQP